MNELKKECIDNLLEIWRTRIKAIREDGREKVILKNVLRL